MKLARHLLAVLALGGSFAPLPAMAQGIQGLGILALDPVADGNTVLTITGQGEVKIAPDVAIFSVGVSNMAGTAAAAMRDNAAQMSRVHAELRRRGVAERDIQTGRTSVDPVTNFEETYGDNRAYADDAVEAAVDAAEAADRTATPSEPRIIGYRANNSVTVRQRELSEYGAMIDGLIAAGANTVAGPQYALENTRPTLDEARRRAVAEARRRAQLYAEAAGMRVMRVVMIDEGRNSGLSSSNSGEFGFADAIAEYGASPSTPASPGELTVQSSVSVMFELAPQ